MGRRSREGLRAALRVRDYRLILGASSISQTGDWLYNVALLVWVYDRTHSAGWVAAVTVARLIPYVVIGPIGGIVADTFDRRRVMIVSDLLRAALMMGLASVTVVDGPVLLAAALAFATTACGTAYRPAVVAMLPDVVGERALAAANGAESVVENLSVVVGPAIGAALLGVGGPSGALALNGVTFLISALLAVALRERSRGNDSDPQPASDLTWFRRLARGFHELGRSSDARVLAGYMLGTSFVYGAQTVILVLVASEQMGTGAKGVGVLYAALGIGGIAGAAIVSRLAHSARLGATLFVGLVLTSVPIAMLAITNGGVPAFMLVVVSGLGTVMVDVLALTQLQRAVPAAVLGRVWGALDALVVAAIIAGSLLVGPAVDGFGTDAAFVVLMLVVPVLGILGIRGLLRSDREAVELLDRIGPIVAVFDELPIFAGAERSVIERLAGSAVEKVLPIGADAVVQGEPADRFYVVESGRLDVYRTEPGQEPTKVGVLATGDWFGEVGLLHNAPRNATVRARWPSKVWCVDGMELLDALSTAPTLSGALLEGMAARLAANER